MEMLHSFAYDFELILCIPTNHKLGVVHIFGLDLHMILPYKSTCMLMKFLFCLGNVQTILKGPRQKNFIYEFTKIFVMKPILKEIHSLSVKVSYFQNEFMKTSFLPKYEQKIVRISALCSEGRNPDNFLFVFWEKR